MRSWRFWFCALFAMECLAQYYTGPRGGCYTYSASGRKRYVSRAYCGTAPTPPRATTSSTTSAYTSPRPAAAAAAAVSGTGLATVGQTTAPALKTESVPWPLGSPCLSVANWDVAPVSHMSRLSVSIRNRCGEAKSARGVVRLWDRDDQVIGEEEIYLGNVPGSALRTVYVGLSEDALGVRLTKLIQRD